MTPFYVASDGFQAYGLEEAYYSNKPDWRGSAQHTDWWDEQGNDVDLEELIEAKYPLAKRCTECELYILDPNDVGTTDIYPDPWQGTNPTTHVYHDGNHDICREIMYEGVMECPQCNRTILDSRGHRPHFKIDPQTDDYICVACYQKQTMAKGQPYEDYATLDKIRGGDFYNEPELKAAGWTYHEYYFISGQRSAAAFNAVARELIEAGNMVLTSYEGLSIMGDEGGVALWKKEPTTPCPSDCSEPSTTDATQSTATCDGH